MDYKEKAIDLGLKENEIELIDEMYESYSKHTEKELRKLIVILETKKAYLPLMFNFPTIALTIAISLPSVMSFIITDELTKKQFGIVFIFYLLIAGIYVVKTFEKYALNVKDISLKLEICKEILGEKMK